MNQLKLANKKTTTSVQEFPNSARDGRKEGISNTNLISLYHTDESNGEIPEAFALVIRGNGMANAGFLDGDQVCFERSCELIDNSIVAVLVDGECVLRRVIKIGDAVQLYGVGKRIEPILFDDDSDMQILGRAVKVVRSLL